MDNFIRIYDKAFPAEECDRIIQSFEEIVSIGGGLLGASQYGGRHIREDTSVLMHNHNVDLCCRIHGILQKHLNQYIAGFSIGSDALELLGSHVKVQKSEVGQGYHVWHSEAGNAQSCGRALTWILYLNDVEEGGETEFANQPMRVRAEQGTLVIFPAAFPWVHRGNPPLSGVKYIATGWWYYA